MPIEVVDGAPGRKHGAWIRQHGPEVGPIDCQGGRNAASDGECCAGCCSYYVCNVCGDRFRVEWPD